MAKVQSLILVLLRVGASLNVLLYLLFTPYYRDKTTLSYAAIFGSKFLFLALRIVLQLSVPSQG